MAPSSGHGLMGTTVPARAVIPPGVAEPFQGTKRAAERLAHEVGVWLGLHRFFVVVAVVVAVAAVTGLWAWSARVGRRALVGRQGLVLVPTESFDPNVEEILRFAAALAGCRVARRGPRCGCADSPRRAVRGFAAGPWWGTDRAVQGGRHRRPRSNRARSGAGSGAAGQGVARARAAALLDSGGDAGSQRLPRRRGRGGRPRVVHPTEPHGSRTGAGPGARP